MVIIIRKEENGERAFHQVDEKSLKQTILQENCVLEEVEVDGEILYRMILQPVKNEELIVKIVKDKTYEIEERKKKLFLKIYKEEKTTIIYSFDARYAFYSQYDHLELGEEGNEVCVNDLDENGVVQFIHSTANPGILYKIPG